MLLTVSGLPLHVIDGETYDRMVAAGLLEGHRCELIDGLLTEASEKTPAHADAVTRLAHYFGRAEGSLSVQAPLRVAVPDSLPEPDLVVTAEPRSRVEHPSSALFVAEVSDGSEQPVLARKVQMYARTRIPRCWLVQTREATIEVLSDPCEDHYRMTVSYRAGDTVPAPLGGLDPLPVASIFPDT